MCALKLTSTVKCKLHWLHLFESLLRALHLARQETQPTPTSSRGVLLYVLYVLMPCASIIHFYRKFHNCASCTCPAAETETRLPTLPPAPEVFSPSSLLSLLLAEVEQGGGIIALVALGQEERRNAHSRGVLSLLSLLLAEVDKQGGGRLARKLGEADGRWRKWRMRCISRIKKVDPVANQSL